MKMNWTSIFSGITLFLAIVIKSQTIENKEVLQPFFQQLQKDQVNQILFLGDSHFQADWLTAFLRKKFQEKYGNAGRGLVFPYAVANSNGPDDFSSATNQTWENFRLVYEQDVFPQIGASGFVIGNQKESFLEIKFKNTEETFDKILIFNDEKMDREAFQLFKENQSLSNFISKSPERMLYTLNSGDTFPELASKFYTTTTKLVQLNGAGIKNPIVGNTYQIEKNTFNYNPDFENSIEKIGDFIFSGNKTEVSLKEPQNVFLMKANAKNGNTFYGFQFLKKVKKGVVFNTIGVNGSTYADFLKFPLQLEQLKSINPKIIIISLGTNESLSAITKEEFQNNVSDLVAKFRKEEKDLPILLISPTDNALKPHKIKEIVSWIKESALQNNVAFFNLYEATGSSGYFKKSLKKKEANADGVHFLKPGYELQAEQIWKALSENFK
jgi:lysophospholipase L1-like esterase/LysM repeat protein